MRHDHSQLKRSLRTGVRQLLGVPEDESLQEFVEQRGAHLVRRGERALRSLERVLQGLGIAPPPRDDAAGSDRAAPRPDSGVAPAPATNGDLPHVELSESSKFDLGQRREESTPREHIPWGYGQDRVTAMPVDPDHLYVYWEVTDDAIAAARRGLGAAGETAWLSLRVYDVTGRIFDGTNAHAYFDHRVERHDRQWFFGIGKPGSTVVVEVGLKSIEGYFVKITRSSRVDFPRSSPVERSGVEWMSVHGASGEVASSHHAPPPPPPSAPAPSPWPAPPGAAANGAGPAVAARSPAAPPPGVPRTEEEERFAFWSDVLPGAWHEVRRSQQWVGDVEHTSWEAGPFAYAVEEPRLEVVEQHGGPTVVEPSGLVTRILEGPWEVVIRGIGGHVKHRVLARWEIVRAAAPAPVHDGGSLGTETLPAGASESAVRRGASERFASEVRLGGASEEFMVGASELRWRGASERLYAGASERRWLGASERLRRGASEYRLGGASERARRGASEYRLGGASEYRLGGASEARLGGASEGRLGGASELAQRARESWQVFAATGTRLAATPPERASERHPAGGAQPPEAQEASSSQGPAEPRPLRG